MGTAVARLRQLFRRLALAASVVAGGCGQGEFSLLTYNVAGLPEGLSASSPSKNMQKIGNLLNDFDVVVLQEDFAYHAALCGHARHTFCSPDCDGPPQRFNESGLARLSRLPTSGLQRDRWHDCNGTSRAGNDCLAPKGFSFAQHQVDLGRTTILIDIYNLHMDAGDEQADRAARQAQALQLLATIASHSQTRAVIVAGDTNVESTWQRPMVEFANAGFQDVCVQLECPMPGSVDRVLYRNSGLVTLNPVRWRVPDSFRDESGEPLSDHLPVAVDFEVILSSNWLGEVTTVGL